MNAPGSNFSHSKRPTSRRRAERVAENAAVVPAEAAQAKSSSASTSIAAVLQRKADQFRTAKRPSISQPLGKYPDETRRPLVSLAFVLPLILLYETGTILLGSDAIRTGVDQWLAGLLSSVGIGQVVVLPLVVTAVMIVWHHRRHDHWRINPAVLAGMLVECVLLGLILSAAAGACVALARASVPDAAIIQAAATAASTVDWRASSVSVLGSGIYEELFFRVILLLPMMAWATFLTQSRRISMAISVVVCSIIFAAVHYSIFNPAGGNFELLSFVFRFGASIVFCNLFLFRGFGIAVGSHVIYDLLTQL